MAMAARVAVAAAAAAAAPAGKSTFSTIFLPQKLGVRVVIITRLGYITKAAHPVLQRHTLQIVIKNMVHNKRYGSIN